MDEALGMKGTKLGEFSGMRPSVSVLVAARNEERNIRACLKCLSKQDYQGEWEVLVGDDSSEDQTLLIATQWAEGNPHFQVFSTIPSEKGLRGKANVLAQLGERTRGDVLLFCDADMQMRADWISNMVSALENSGVDMLNGTTSTSGQNFFSKWQGVDWLIPQGHFAWLSRLGIAFTAMGNNMAITRKAYESTGGYGHIPDSITEDFELFKQAKKRGFRLIHHFDPAVLGTTSDLNSPLEWYHQHLRWMVGFMQLPFAQQWVFYGQLALLPLILITWTMGFSTISFSLFAIWFFKILADVGLVWWMMGWKWIPALLVYEFLWWPAYASCLVGYLTKKKIGWKGRSWEK